MATRARELLDRSRVLIGRSREAAAQIISTSRQNLAAAQAPPRPAPRALEPRAAVQDSGPPPPSSEQALSGICGSIALRDLNLVDSLLAQLEEMESQEEDQERLAELYRLDHLATRLRRNAENLRVLAGRDAGDGVARTTSLVDVIRAAMSSIDHYSRITIGRVASLGVVGFAADDLGRLVAELLDNAANQSPPNTPVRVSAHLTEQGSVLLRIEDEGIGMPAEKLESLNERLVSDPVLDDDSVRHMGLAVVRRLSARHDMRTRLDRRSPHGTTATVLLPSTLVSELPEASWSGAQTVVFPQTPAPEHPAAVPAARAARPASPSGNLPQRRSPTGQPAVRRRPAPGPPPGEPRTGTTPNGLPRRVSRSIKNLAEQPAPPQTPQPPQADQRAGHDRLLADLDAFSTGEQAARDERNGAEQRDRAEGTEQ
ncbi:ATP-binding protein [Amycolatopsis antarctica]|uniref:histidine kinase n=1 Tax=Amycolatopsis antarctica TaxID=1854586 RepID=A0A263CVE1_9PSEU|nr:ATP-binding protein [Amycolatopsis antarctica]OZM69958.1 ATP-binding protein [Amycolatopsis antarctica]